jgi:hypothetical protein
MFGGIRYPCAVDEMKPTESEKDSTRKAPWTDVVQAIGALVPIASGVAFAVVGQAGWLAGSIGLLGLVSIMTGVALWWRSRRSMRGRRRVATVALAALGFLLVGFAILETANGRRPEADAGSKVVPTPSATVSVTPFESSPTPVATFPTRTAGPLQTSGGSSEPTTATTPKPSRSTTVGRPSSSPTTEPSGAEVDFFFPREGNTVRRTDQITGTIRASAGNEVWLFWQHGAGGPLHPHGPCTVTGTWTCPPLQLDPGGDETFFLTAAIVSGATGDSLRSAAGAAIAELPPHSAKRVIRIVRQAE